MGGKRRIAKKIIPVIMEQAKGHSGNYWEPFVGGGGMASEIGSQFNKAVYSDIHPDLIMMWSALSKGWIPPTDISVEMYKDLRHSKPSALRGFVGFGGSFGGRWFEGYARGGTNADGTPRNHQAESQRAVLKDIEGMKAKHKTVFIRCSYYSLDPQPGDVVYCDPPYAGTKKYSKTDLLDHEKFWATAEMWARNGVHVFVSEYSAPDGWECIWEQPLRSSVRIGSDERHIATERLFTYKSI